jgi:hypothetical protein
MLLQSHHGEIKLVISHSISRQRRRNTALSGAGTLSNRLPARADRELENAPGTVEQLQVLERWFSAVVASTQPSCGQGAEMGRANVLIAPSNPSGRRVNDRGPPCPSLEATKDSWLY